MPAKMFTATALLASGSNVLDEVTGNAVYSQYLVNLSEAHAAAERMFETHPQTATVEIDRMDYDHDINMYRWAATTAIIYNA